MANHSFICNACIYLECEKDESMCEHCNGLGYNWEPINKALYERDPHYFMKTLILASHNAKTGADQ